MKYIQVLSCSSDLGSCCSDAGLVSIIDIVRKAMDMFQLIVPIVLLVMLAVQLTKLVMNPDEKNGIKKVSNRIIAAIVVFILPIIVNIVITNLPANESFQLSACWNTAKDIAEMQRTGSNTYNEKYDNKRVNLFETNKKKTPTTAGNGSEKGKSIVNYAMGQVGKPYQYGGSWNGSLPYTPTDCSGFVQAVYHHFGVELARTTSSIWNDTSKYTLVNNNDIRAGDLAMYEGHVAIFTGNGFQIVHAANTQKGVVVDDDYTKAASNFKGIMRIKGVY